MQSVDPKVGKVPLNKTQNIWRTQIVYSSKKSWQSVIRVWRSNYINFSLEQSKITHRWRCSTSGVWGSWLWLSSHHDGDSTQSASTCRSAPLYHKETCRDNRPLWSQTRGWKSRLLGQAASVTSSRPLP
ncbi:hypothetical protein Zmor_025540 [Zophobas morio]|uniref:Uncharacterized protein n=1 Tax=Zophobas morio TaxID=2755281 RepID=A0AA38M3R5_9CUCU|nr:hypothetical protein Zmor_025540 [Zophobas morio]